jgi:hypothetical protein
MHFALLLSLFLTAPVVAQLRTQPKVAVSFATHLEFAKSSELETIRKMNGRLHAGDRSLCQYNRQISVSKCALQMIRSYRVHSSQALRSLLDLAVSLAVVDRDKGFSELEVNRDLAESFLAVAENARPEKFFAAQINARNGRDRLEKTQSRIAENAALQSFRTQVIPLIGFQISKAEAWPLRARAERVRGRRWALR